VNERTPAHGRASPSATNVDNDSTRSEGRKRADVTRYPPVTVAALQRLPGSSARSFAIGVALGQWIDAEGSSARLVGRAAAGSVIKREKVPEVLEAIGITARTWREYVAEWERNYIAHRCGRATVCLLTRPLQDRCPSKSCREWIPIDHAEKPAHLPRGPGFRNGVNSASPTASSAPPRDTNSAVRDDANGTSSAASGHDSATPDSGGFNGREVGRYEPKSPKGVQGPPQEDLLVSRAAELESNCVRCQRYGPNHDGDHTANWEGVA
jgi:hypothetical protein